MNISLLVARGKSILLPLLTTGSLAAAALAVDNPTLPPPPPATAAAIALGTPGFDPPYPPRSNPFQLPDSKAALATRREAVVQHIDLQLKGFVNVGGSLRAVVAIDGDVVAMAEGERRGDIEMMEVTPPTMTLQRGRHRWTESLLEPNPTKGGAKSR